MDILDVVSHRLPHSLKHVSLSHWGCSSYPIQVIHDGSPPQGSVSTILLLCQGINLFANSFNETKYFKHVSDTNLELEDDTNLELEDTRGGYVFNNEYKTLLSR